MAQRHVSGFGVIGALLAGGALLLGLVVLAVFAAPVILVLAPVMVGWAIWDERLVVHEQARRAREAVHGPEREGTPAHAGRVS
jgi:hypothetical protein